MSYQLLQGDVLDKLRELPDESVHCVVTSPPYWGLRDYGTGKWEGGDDPFCDHRVSGQVQDTKAPGAIVCSVRPGVDASVCIDCGAVRQDNQIGLEKTPEEYVEKMTEVFREVRRVIRNDGTLWLNIGDSYFASPTGSQSKKAVVDDGRQEEATKRPAKAGGKPKDLVGIPWLTAFGLRADGWYLRQDIIWAKPNVMPESVLDRCTKSHEHVFLLTKSPKYFYDAEAVKEPTVCDRKRGPATHPDTASTNGNGGLSSRELTAFRNKRDVWTIPTRSYREAHFATFPEALVEPCILAGTSEKGCCSVCAAPWLRVVESKRLMRHELPTDHPDYRPGRYTVKAGGEDDYAKGGGQAFRFSETVGWKPGCKCGGDAQPCVVLDPFSGAATTGVVALKAGRDYVGIELNPEYVEMSRRRLEAL